MVGSCRKPSVMDNGFDSGGLQDEGCLYVLSLFHTANPVLISLFLGNDLFNRRRFARKLFCKQFTRVLNRYGCIP